MTFPRLISIAGLALAAGTGFAQAASEAAWDAFRLEMNARCTELAGEFMDEIEIRVDPFGSQSYGLALVSGQENGERSERLCVMDKQSRRVELGNPIPPLASAPTEPVDTPDQPATKDARTCNEACAATEALLAPEDKASLEGIGEQVDATLADLAERDEVEDPETGRIAALVSDGNPDLDFDAVAPGSYRCDVYWYGFLDQGARQIGSHRCEIANEDGALTVHKVSGDRLSAVLMPWADGRRAFVGRTFLGGHRNTAYDPANPANPENENYGNKVGIALADGGTLYLVSTQARGMQPKDDTFFEVIELVPAQ